MSISPPQSPLSLPADSLARLRSLTAGGQRKLLGLVGAPGAGKSTLAALLRDALGAERAQVVPMDGFHLANVELKRLGRADRKGAPDTFDSAGYVALLRRLREQRPGGDIVYAPEFRREIEEPVAGAIAVLPETQLVITEGNYLLHDGGPWAGAAALLDEVWYVDIDDALPARAVRPQRRGGARVGGADRCAERAADRGHARAGAPRRRAFLTAG